MLDQAAFEPDMLSVAMQTYCSIGVYSGSQS